MSLSIVSASEINVTDIEDNVLYKSIEENNLFESGDGIYVGNLNESYVHDGSYNAPFNNIKDAISAANDNSTIILMDGVYKGVNNLNIEINKNITIKSLNKNSTIDGEGKYVFFNILSSNRLTLEDLNFINGYNNLNSDQSGLIENNGDLIIKETTFKNMKSFMGVIFNKANLEVHNSKFSSISSSTLAQIIVNLKNSMIVNSTLPYNPVDDGSSTTIYNYNKISIFNSSAGVLISNYDYADGNYNKLDISVKNSEFYLLQHNNGSANISNSNFQAGLTFTNADVNLDRIEAYSQNSFSSPIWAYNSNLTIISSIIHGDISTFSSVVNISYSVILGTIGGNGGISEVNDLYNWWGDNNGPKILYAKTNASIWIVMLFTCEESPITVGTNAKFTVSLKSTMGTSISDLPNPILLPRLHVNFEAQNGNFLYSGGYLSNAIFNNYLMENNENCLVYAIINSQRLRLVVGSGLTNYTLCVSPTKGSNAYGDGSYENPYQTLEHTLKKALNGNTIYLLEGTYSYGFNSNLDIDKNITIIGLENAVMSRDNGRNIFNIANYGSLTIKNITFTVNSMDYGNSLFVVNGGLLTIINSSFKNIASSAIVYANGVVDIYNSTFVNNKASIFNGGAHFYMNNVLVENTSNYYTNRIYKEFNCIIPIKGSVEIYNSIFRYNNVGIISLNPNHLTSASYSSYSFYSRYAYLENTSFISNCFKNDYNDYASSGIGFDIYESHETFQGFINNCSFIDNYGPLARVNSINSSIFINNDLTSINALSVNNSYFERNANFIQSGNSYVGNGVVTANNIINSTFILNKAAYGGALYNPKVVHYSSFINNSAIYNGDDIFSYSGDVDYSSNWWGDNQKPTSKKVYIFLGNLIMENWIIMTFDISDNIVKASLNTLLDDNQNISKLNYIINERPVFFFADFGSIQPSNTKLSNNVAYANVIHNKTSLDFKVYAKIDNQILDLFIRNNSTQIIMENNVFYGGNNKYSFSLINVNGFKIADQTLTVEIVNGTNIIESFEVKCDENAFGEFNFKYPIGLYEINIYYNGNGYFEKTNNTAFVNVLPSITYLTTHNTTYYGKNNYYRAVLTDVNGMGIINRTITFKIINSNGQIKKINVLSDEYGRGEFYLTLDIGVYTIESTFDGDNWYLQSFSKSQINIRPVNSTLIVENLVLYGLGNVYNITLMDSHGTLIRDENIDVTITQDNLTDKFNLKTNNQGVAQLIINYLPGTYDVIATYAGDDIYGSAEASATLTVKKVLTMISGYHYITIPLNGVYDVVLSDMYGRLIPNQTITLNLYKGNLVKSMSGVSDGNGEITFILDLTEGTYLATLDYGGNIWYEESTAASTIVISDNAVINDVSMNATDLVQYYGENKYFVISFNDPNAFSQYGKTIVVTISSKGGSQSYNLLTDAFGQARMQIDLNPGTYNVTYKYSNKYYGIFCEKSNNIHVYSMPTIIYASDIVMKVNQKKYLEIHLNNINNNPIKNMPVNVEISGEKYNLTTNDEGIARLLISKGAGDYDVKFSFSHINYLSSNNTAHILVVDSDKTSTSIDASDKIIYDNENIGYTVVLRDILDNPISGANVKITISTIQKEIVNTYSVNTNNFGEALFKLKLNYGTYLININYAGSEIYLESSALKYIQVLPSDNLTKTLLSGYFDNNNTYNVVLIDEYGNLLSNKQIIFKINNESLSKSTNIEGIASIDLGLIPGIYNVDARFLGDNTYEKSFTKDSRIISGNLTYLFALDIVKYYKNATQFHAQLLNSMGMPLTNKTINITINGSKYSAKTDNNGWVSLNIDFKPGFYEAISGYLSDNAEETVYTKSTINVLPTIIANDLIKYYRNASQFYVQLLKGDGSPISNTNISMNLSGVFYKIVSDENGIARLNIDNLPGVYNLTVQNPYDGLLKSFKITVLEYGSLENSFITGKLVNTSYILTLMDSSNLKISNAKLNVMVNDKLFDVVSDDNGNVLINLGSAYGIYYINAVFDGDGKYKNTSFSDNVIRTGNLNYLFAFDVVKYYRNGTQFYAQLVDELGNPLSGKVIIININGRNYNRTTNLNGWIKLNINLNPGVYEVTCSYYGDTPQENSYAIAKITVLSVTFAENLVKFYKNGSQFYVRVIDGVGNPIKGENVTMNINGVFYNRKTNSDGVAKLNINLNPGFYILTAYNPYGGFASSYNITVLATIMGQNIVKYYKNGTQYHVQLLDGTGNPLKGSNVTLNINGVFYVRKTNDLGIAKLNINLAQGEYIITAIHPSGLRCSNNITVLPILYADDLKIHYNDGSRFKVTLLDSKGNLYSNQYVTFNINGVFYQRLTNSGGNAYLNIKLMTGKYIISSMYGDCTISNTITII